MLSELALGAGAAAAMFQQFLGTTPATTLPECNPWTGPSCSCPPHTVYRASTTWATIAANPHDVYAISGSCEPLSFSSPFPYCRFQRGTRCAWMRKVLMQGSP